MKKWLFNPFVYIAGAKSLFIGLAVMAATAVIGFYSNTHFDGVIDLHNGRISPLAAYFGEQLIDLVCAAIMFFIAGKLLSRSSIRLIDVVGTMAMARWVMIFCAVIGFGIHTPAVMPHTIEDIQKLATPSNILLSLLSFVFVIWMVALMYNAFRVSCNVKGGEATGAFIIALIVAEVLSKIVIHFFYKQLI